MRRVLCAIFLAVALLCAAPISPRVRAASSDPDFPTVAAGTEFPVEVEGSINAAKARPGDPVRFQTLEPILIGSNVVVPAHSRLVGRVIEAHPATESSDSLLRFSIHLVEWRKNSYVMVNAVVTGRMRSKSHIRGDIRVAVPSFLEGVRIQYEPEAAATTMLTSRDNFVLRGGTMLVLRNLGAPVQRPTAEPHVGQ